MTHGLMGVLVLVPVFLFSLCLHEYAHAWVATRLGDPTPGSLGRLSLHPLAHADTMGTLIIPSVCIFYGLPFFGWAKPVPIDARYFKNERWGMAAVAAAGPAANLLIAGVAALVLGAIVRMPLPEFEGYTVNEAAQILTVITIQVNLFLALFNLLPLPPLDGFMVIQAVLPLKWANQAYKITPYAGFILLLLLFTGGLQMIGAPVGYLFRALIGFVT